MGNQKDFKCINLRIEEIFRSVSLEPYKSIETIHFYEEYLAKEIPKIDQDQNQIIDIEEVR